MEAFMHRFHPQLGIVQKFIEEGKIGKLKVVEASFRHHMTKTDDVRLVAEYGGGALFDVGSYCVNVCRLFLGEHPKNVYAAASFDTSHNVDISTQGMMDYGDGKWGLISCGFESGLHQSLVLSGTEGKITLNEPFITWTGKPRLTLQIGRSEYVYEMEEVNTFKEEIEEFCDAIIEKREPCLPVKDSILNAELVERIAEQIKQCS